MLIVLNCFMFGMAQVFLFYIMAKVKIKSKTIRKVVVIINKLIRTCFFVLAIINISVIMANFYLFMYVSSCDIVYMFCKNNELARYVSLTSVLVMFQPILYLFLKILKKKLYREMEMFELQDTVIDIISRIKCYIDCIPIKGIIHVINVIFVILVNSWKILDVETNFTASSIYMSIATFYAMDKAIDYFAKKYKDFWIKIDNKLFETKKINDSNKVTIEDIKTINKLIYLNYIETGKYGFE